MKISFAKTGRVFAPLVRIRAHIRVLLSVVRRVTLAIDPASTTFLLSAQQWPTLQVSGPLARGTESS